MTKRKIVLQKLGGHFQLAMSTADDLKNMCELDEAHWMAVIAPTGSLICDPAFLKFIDTDNSGSIRSNELREAWEWISDILNDHQAITKKTTELELKTINTASENGKKLLATAHQVIQNLGLEDSTRISLDQTRGRQNILSKAECNGDGIIPPEATDDVKIQQLINDIMATVGSADDLSGAKGTSAELLDSFLADAKAYLEWHETGRIPIDAKTTEIMCRGTETQDKLAIIDAVETKIDEFFMQCKLLKLDANIATQFSLDPETIKALNVSDPEAVNTCLLKAPLSHPNTDDMLHLDDRLNPAYATKVEAFIAEYFPDAKGISKAEWKALKAEFAPYREWIGKKAGAAVESLGVDRLKELLDAPPEIERLRQLIDFDKSVADELDGITNLEKVILFQRWLIDLANNFISFNQLFDPSSSSLIQAGSLVMDGRHFDFCVKVTDRAKHKTVAVKSNICTMYLKLTRKLTDKEETMEIATAVTAGTMGYLYVGKSGVFMDSNEQKWDAEVLEIISHPVSITEALKMPFVKLSEFIKAQVDKFTSSRYKELESSVGKSLDSAEQKLTAPAPPPPQAQSSAGGLSFLMLGGGISLAAIGSSFAYMTKALKGISLTHVLMVIGGIFLIVATPIVIVALIKLRKRNLGMFLEAGGWAINAPMRLTHQMGLLFTRVPAYPDGSSFKRFELLRALAKKAPAYNPRRKLKAYLLILAALCCLVGGYYLGIRIFADPKVPEPVKGAKPTAASTSKSANPPKPAQPASPTPAAK